MFRMLFLVYRRLSFRTRRFVIPFVFLVRFIARIVLRNRVRLFGYYQHLDFADNASFKYYVDREKYESTWLDFFRRIISLNPESFVMDIGANYGPYTLAAAALGQYGLVKKVFSFEPAVRPFTALRRSVQENGFENLVEVHNKIVGDKPGKATLFPSRRSSASNRTFQTTSETIPFAAGIQLDCVTLDGFLEQETNMKQSKFVIKLDIEGNEPRAFRGMEQTLLTCQGFMVFFEFHGSAIQEVGLDLDSFFQFLEELKFDFALEQRGDSISEIEGKRGLIARMKEVSQTKDERFGTMATFFAIGRDMNRP